MKAVVGRYLSSKRGYSVSQIARMSMYDKVVACMTKDPEERTNEEISELFSWFRKKSDLFQNSKPEVIYDIMRNCTFVNREKDYVIIRQGDRGDCFYIMLQGKVSIYINNAISDEEDSQKREERARQADVHKTDRGELDRSKFGIHIASLDTAGKSFGELALINKDCIRNASIIADDSTDLIIVNRALYNRSLRAAQEAEFAERTQFVAENEMFRYWATKHKKQLSFSLRRAMFTFDSAIVKQGDTADVLYFLRKGQAKLVADSSTHKSQYPSWYPLEDNYQQMEDEEDEIFLSNTKKKKSASASTSERGSLAMVPSACRRKETMRKSIEISIVGVNDIIGDAEIVLEMGTYMQSAICTQVCHLYALDMKNYERLVSKRNPRSIDIIREYAETKMMSRAARLHDEQVPLLRAVLFKLQVMGQPQRPKRKENKSSTFAPTGSFEIVPQRGALIDLYGPGTVFYRNKMRENAKKKAKNKANFFGGASIRFGLRMGAMPNTSGGYPAAGFPETQQQDVKVATYENVDEDDEVEDEEGIYRRANVRPVYPNDFKDFKSSDRVLADLEHRIQEWHTYPTEMSAKALKPADIKMRRVHMEPGKDLKPGACVVMRRRKNKHERMMEAFGSDGEDDVNTHKAQITQGGHDGAARAHTLHGETNGNPASDSDSDSGAVKTAVHNRRIQGTPETAFLARALNGSYKPGCHGELSRQNYLPMHGRSQTDPGFTLPPHPGTGPLESNSPLRDRSRSPLPSLRGPQGRIKRTQNWLTSQSDDAKGHEGQCLTTHVTQNSSNGNARVPLPAVVR